MIMNKLIFLLLSCFVSLKLSAQISVDVFSQNDSIEAGDTISSQTGDTFSYLSQESFIEIDPMASFSRSYGVYLRGAPNSSHKYFVDGHDMEDITGIARTARMDLNVSSPLDKTQISLGPQGVGFGPGASAGVFSNRSSKKSYHFFRLNNHLGTSFVSQKNDTKLSYRVAGEFIDSPSVFPQGEEKDSNIKIDLRTWIESKYGSSSLLYVQNNQDYDELSADSFTNSSSFKKISFLHKDKWFSSNFKREISYKTGLQLTNREENFSNKTENYSAQTLTAQFKNAGEKSEYLVRGKLERYGEMENLTGENNIRPMMDLSSSLFFKETFIDTAGISVSITNDNEVIPSLEFSKSIDNLKLKVSSSGRLPSYYELYSSFGNENLKPQKTFSGDLFFENSNLRLSAFIQEYKNFINYDFFNNRYENIDHLMSYGAEASIKYLRLFDIGLSYKRMKSLISEKILPGRNTFTTSMILRPWRGVNLIYRGVFGRYGFNEEKLNSLHFVSLDYGFNLSKNEKITVSGKNLLNEKSNSLFPTQNGGVVTQLDYIYLL